MKSRWQPWTCWTLGIAFLAAGGAVADDAALMAMEKGLWAAWASGDSAVFEEHLGNDAVMVTSAGTTLGKTQAIADLGMCSVASYEVGEMTVLHPADNVAILVYSAAQDATCEGNALPAKVNSTSVWVEQDGHWVSVLYAEAPAPE
jgi:hypothetical protein